MENHKKDTDKIKTFEEKEAKKEERMKRRNWRTTHEAAKILMATPTTVIQWIKDGKLKAFYTPGGHRRLSTSSIDKLYSEIISGKFQQGKGTINAN